jgi:hypothetical protein
MSEADGSERDAQPDPGAGGMHAGPWLLVTGMHRSGTSAVAGVLGALGFQTPSADDRMDWPESNPEHCSRNRAPSCGRTRGSASSIPTGSG